jgi:hypothetical protein
MTVKTSDTCKLPGDGSQLVCKRMPGADKPVRAASAGVGGCRGWLNYAASEQIVLRVHHMRCEIPHRCVRRKYRIRRPFAIQAAQLLGRAIGAGLFAITPAGERGMCCKAIKLGNARVFPVTTL